MEYGVIVDVETTGLDPSADKIIEIGVLEFSLPTEEAPSEIVNMYGGVEDPGFPLREEIVKITGLRDGTIAGQKIDWALVRTLLGRSSLIVAHNAAFDRSFVTRRPELSSLNKKWACSMRHIDWAVKGHKTQALNYLAADSGFLNPFAHRALFDCATTFRLIQPHLPELLIRKDLKTYKISAFGASFDVKDKLKAQRYRWDAPNKVWCKEIQEDALEAERAFLSEHIYGFGRDKHGEELIGEDSPPLMM